MITLEFSIDKQTMTRQDNEKVVSNSSNIHQCHFSFSEDWNGKEISAIFYKGISTVAVMLDENNNCFIPTQLLKASYPVDIKVSCFGVEEDEIITSTLVDIPVLVGLSTSGASPEIAYNLFEQIMQRIDQVKKGEIEQELILEAVNDYLTEHHFDDVIVSKIAEYVTSHVAELKGEKGDRGLKGDNGKSAYQVAVDNGFVGTEQQWLASLKGDKGDKGDSGINGKSAYQIAVDNGFSGTETEWIESLKGDKGDTKLTFVGVCESAKNEQNKEATVDNGFKLEKGVRVAIKYSQSNTFNATASNPITLNVNNTGAKNIYYNNSATPTGANTTAFGYANRYVYYIYDGNYWVFDGTSYDNGTNYSTMSVDELTTGTASSNRVLRADYLHQAITEMIDERVAAILAERNL